MSNRTALVTGGSRGIGRAIVLGLVRVGWSVVFSYHTAQSAANSLLAEIDQIGGQGLAFQCDIRKATNRQNLLAAAIDHYGRIDLLVNNAGIAPRQRLDLLEIEEASYNEVMETNLKGPFFLTQAVSKEMIRLLDEKVIENPIIINIGSLNAYVSSIQRGEYCLSKAGIGMMTALFADRLAVDGILVYEIRPGIVETDMTAVVHGKYDQLIENGLLPLKRWGKPQDVARGVVALADGCLPYSTGEVINIDGGFHLRRF
jgi:3-oxoacyl-[acyl-carrier protein] reductase